MPEMCPYTSFFWSIFSRMRADYEDLSSKTPYLVLIRENKDHLKQRIWTIFSEWRTKCMAIDTATFNFTVYSLCIVNFEQVLVHWVSQVCRASRIPLQ